MRRGKVADVDIVANAASIRCVVVSTEHVDMVALPDSGFHSHLDEVCRAFADLARASLRIGSGNVEIAQRRIIERVRSGTVLQHALLISLDAP